MSNKRLISLDNFKVETTSVASTPTICGLHVTRILSLDAIIDEFPQLLVPVLSPQIPKSMVWNTTSSLMAQLFLLVLVVSNMNN